MPTNKKTATTTALATVDTFKIANRYEGVDPELLAELQDQMEDLDPESGITCRQIKVPSAGGIAYEVQGDEDGDADPMKEVEGVILFTHRLNGYWPNVFGTASNPEDKIPTCSSMDGKTGMVQAGSRSGEVINCETCPYTGPHHGERGQGPGPPGAEDGEGLPPGIPEYHRGQRQRVPGLRRNGAVPPPPDAPDPDILLPPIQRLRAGEQRKHEPDRPPLLPKGYQLRRSDSRPGRPGGGLDEQLPQGHTWVAVRRGAVRGTPAQLNTSGTSARASPGRWPFFMPWPVQGREKGPPKGSRKGRSSRPFSVN